MALEIRTVGEHAAQEITADKDFSEIPITMEQRLDIACGQQLQPGWTGMDIADIILPLGAKANYIHHNVLSFPWPIESNSIYEARCSHFVEHIPHQLEGSDITRNGLVLFMEELYRVMMPQGIVTIMAPYYSSQRAWQDPTHCFSDDTEILTRVGFKKITELKIGEEVLTRNIKTGETEIVPVVNTIFEAYKGRMLHFKSLNMDMLVTPNHDLLVGTNNKNYPNWRVCRADEMLELKGHHSRKGIGTIDWCSGDTEGFEINRIARSQFYKKNIYLPIQYDAELFMRFMGWFLSEGSLKQNKGKTTYQIEIHQTKNVHEDNYKEIVKVVQELGFRPQLGKDRVSFSSKDLFAYLQQFGYSHEKYIPVELKECGIELLQCLLDSLLKGDGIKNGNGFTYGSVSKRLSDDVQEIALKCGYRATQSIEHRVGKQWHINGRSGEQRDMYLVFISQPAELYYPQPEIVEYDGNIACVTVAKNNTIYVRRNGRGMWAGNCRCITENTFRYFDKKWLEALGMGHYNINADFEVLTTKMILDPEYESKNESAKQNAIRHYINVVLDIHIVLRKREVR